MTLGDFSRQAEVYGCSRPGYPPAFVDYLMQATGVQPSDPVADIGAGTGIFTQLLAERGLQVTAVEPSEEMQAKSVADPNIRWVKGTFERSNLPASSQAWVVAAQAFHWADPPRALPEMRRILRPGGAFTIVWNNRRNQDSAALRWVNAAISRHVPEFDHAYRTQPWIDVLTSTGDFSNVVVHGAQHIVLMSRQRFSDLWRSSNRLNSIAGDARMSAFLAELSQFLGEQPEVIDVPYVCEAWTAR